MVDTFTYTQADIDVVLGINSEFKVQLKIASTARQAAEQIASDATVKLLADQANTGKKAKAK